MLLQIRKTVADKFGVLPYHIMNNVAIESISTNRPTSIPDLAILPGMGEIRAKKYGADILACVRAVLQCDGLDAAENALLPAVPVDVDATPMPLIARSMFASAGSRLRESVSVITRTAHRGSHRGSQPGM